MIILRALKFIVFLAFLGAAGAFIYESLNSPKYQSGFSFILVNQKIENQNPVSPKYLEKAASGVGPYILSDSFIEFIEEKNQQNDKESLKNIDKENWKESIRVKKNLEANLISVRIFDNDPNQAYLKAQEISFHLEEGLNQLLNSPQIKLKIINSPYQPQDFHLSNLIIPTVKGALLGGVLGFILFILFGARVDKWLYKKPTLPSQPRAYYPTGQNRMIQNQTPPLTRSPQEKIQNQNQNQLPNYSGQGINFYQNQKALSQKQQNQNFKPTAPMANSQTQSLKQSPDNKNHKQAINDQSNKDNQINEPTQPNQSPNQKQKSAKQIEEEQIKERLNRLISG
ncbi:MAG: hypothetical protein GF335_03355 [Candidatus Moranbacteria bacterium]|nr:hypothetical protein [Candidatus Moranbacteria bacterium]